MILLLTIVMIILAMLDANNSDLKIEENNDNGNSKNWILSA